MDTISLGLLQVTRYSREGKRPNGVGTTIQLSSSLGLPQASSRVFAFYIWPGPQSRKRMLPYETRHDWQFAVELL